MNYDNLHLEKGMYQVTGKSFSAVLEELDPSNQYVGTKLENLDAFERQLKRFDIKVGGKYTDPVEKFFSTPTSSALFPEYVKRAVLAGNQEANLLNELIATRTYIDSMDYRSIASVPSTEDKSAKPVAEGASIPTTTIRMQENLVQLNKRGRMLVASYEAIRFQKIDLFTVTLRQIGNQIAKQQLADAIAVLQKGDGNQNPAEVVSLLGANFGYGDLLNLWSKFEDFSLTTMVADSKALMKLLSLSELKDPMTGLHFQSTGNLATPMGAALFKSQSVPENTLIGLDKNCALEMVSVGDINIEYDKLIDRQLDRAAITATAGFTKVFSDAAKVMVI